MCKKNNDRIMPTVIGVSSSAIKATSNNPSSQLPAKGLETNLGENLKWEVKDIIPITKKMLERKGESNLKIIPTNSYALRFE
jgi:hypothetical protein